MMMTSGHLGVIRKLDVCCVIIVCFEYGQSSVNMAPPVGRARTSWGHGRAIQGMRVETEYEDVDSDYHLVRK